MKALLYTDWCTARGMFLRYVAVCGIMCVVLCVSGAADEPDAAALAAYVQQTFVMLAGMITTLMCFLNLFSSDERVGWESVRLALPLSRRQVVRSRYVFLIALLLAMVALGAVLGAIAGAVATGIVFGSPVFPADPDILLTMALCVLAVVLYASLEMPLFFWKGATKARAAFSLPLVLLPLLSLPGVSDWIRTLDITPQMALAVGAPITAGVLLVSVGLSARLYERRDF